MAMEKVIAASTVSTACLDFLVKDPRHPSLQTKPIQGTSGIYEARVDIDYRLTYERNEDDTLILRVAARHDMPLQIP